MNIKDLPVKVVCPLGVSQCRQLKGDVIEQCAWLVNIAGKHPQSDETVDEWRCSMAWMPILLVENAQTNRGQTQAIEAFRNGVIQQNTQLINAMADKKRLIDANRQI